MDERTEKKRTGNEANNSPHELNTLKLIQFLQKPIHTLLHASRFLAETGTGSVWGFVALGINFGFGGPVDLAMDIWIAYGVMGCLIMVVGVIGVSSYWWLCLLVLMLLGLGLHVISVLWLVVLV
jgi:hypothetical protein